MITLQTIRDDLNEIRYYYSRKDVFDKASDCIGKNVIVDKVRKYNDLICFAEPKLYELYLCLYVNNNTQEGAAEELNYSVDYLVKGKKRLFKFFFDKLNA